MNVINIFRDIKQLKEKDIMNIEYIIKVLFPMDSKIIVKNRFYHNLCLFLYLDIFIKNGQSFNNIIKNYQIKMSCPVKFYSHISYSYCESMVCCGVSKWGIGLDVQEIIQVQQNELEEYATEAELKYIKDSNNFNYDAIKLFTLKESYGKYYGVGLNYLLNQISLYNRENKFKLYGLWFQSYQIENCMLSYCSMNSEIKFNELSYNQFNARINKILNCL